MRKKVLKKLIWAVDSNKEVEEAVEEVVEV